MGLQCWQNLTSATDWSGSQGMREQTSQFYNLTSRTLALTLGGGNKYVHKVFTTMLDAY